MMMSSSLNTLLIAGVVACLSVLALARYRCSRVAPLLLFCLVLFQCLSLSVITPVGMLLLALLGFRWFLFAQSNLNRWWGRQQEALGLRHLRLTFLLTVFVLFWTVIEGQLAQVHEFSLILIVFFCFFPLFFALFFRGMKVFCSENIGLVLSVFFSLIVAVVSLVGFPVEVLGASVFVGALTVLTLIFLIVLLFYGRVYRSFHWAFSTLLILSFLASILDPPAFSRYLFILLFFAAWWLLGDIFSGIKKNFRAIFNQSAVAMLFLVSMFLWVEVWNRLDATGPVQSGASFVLCCLHLLGVWSLTERVIIIEKT